jgi:hypothetical protein
MSPTVRETAGPPSAGQALAWPGAGSSLPHHRSTGYPGTQPSLTDAGPAGPGRQADPRLAPADVAAAVMYAVAQPAGVDVSEIMIRPVGQDPFR